MGGSLLLLLLLLLVVILAGVSVCGHKPCVCVITCIVVVVVGFWVGYTHSTLPFQNSFRKTKNQKPKPKIKIKKVFSGNRPSMSLLIPSHDPFHLGQLLALYEHRVAVQGR
jgi:hypothetical protein